MPLAPATRGGSQTTGVVGVTAGVVVATGGSCVVPSTAIQKSPVSGLIVTPGTTLPSSHGLTGIVVAGGHSDATLDQLSEGIDNGLRLFTHLGNGCPSAMPRHDNIVQRVLSLSDSLMVSFIADGHHVPGFALSNYLKRVPDDSIVIVSDAISAAGLGPGRYELSDQIVEVDEDGAAWAACRTHYAGCATPQHKMAEWLVEELDCSETQIEKWFCGNPMKLIGKKD